MDGEHILSFGKEDVSKSGENGFYVEVRWLEVPEVGTSDGSGHVPTIGYVDGNTPYM